MLADISRLSKSWRDVTWLSSDVIYQLSRYLTLNPANFADHKTEMVFLRLCVCRAGQNDLELVHGIVQRVVASVRSEDQDVISPVGAIRIFHILTHIRPLYFNNETTKVSDILQEDKCGPGLQELVCWVKGTNGMVPSLGSFCIACVRNKIHDSHPHMSVVQPLKFLAGFVSPKTIAILRLDHIFGCKAKQSNMGETYSFVTGKL